MEEDSTVTKLWLLGCEIACSEHPAVCIIGISHDVMGCLEDGLVWIGFLPACNLVTTDTLAPSATEFPTHFLTDFFLTI
jgi:hypothetical protein